MLCLHFLNLGYCFLSVSDAVDGSGLKTVPPVIIIWACLFSSWPLWRGCTLLYVQASCPSPLPDLCSLGPLAERWPCYSASNKQLLINHALLITEAPVGAGVCHGNKYSFTGHVSSSCMFPPITSSQASPSQACFLFQPSSSSSPLPPSHRFSLRHSVSQLILCVCANKIR